jgi:transcription antitermination protein NusB
MKSRHRAREIALQILYRFDMASHQSGVPIPSGPALLGELNQHFDHFAVPLELREFAAQLVAGTLAEVARLDALIEKHASNWRISRMGYVDRSLLRMATYEMAHFAAEVPHSVVINEAIELGKQFGAQETPAFINGVLDAVKSAIAAQAGQADPRPAGQSGT